MTEKENKYIQKVPGKFLSYVRAVDTKMLTVISEIALQQSALTAETMKWVKQFLYYLSSQEDATVTLQKTDTKLAGHSDEEYLN